MRLVRRPACEDVVAVLHDYTEGRLDPKLATAVKPHFHDCADWRNLLRTYER
jgi:hypothetical protein